MSLRAESFKEQVRDVPAGGRGLFSSDRSCERALDRHRSRKVTCDQGLEPKVKVWVCSGNAEGGGETVLQTPKSEMLSWYLRWAG